MKLLLLCREPRLYSCQRLLTACQQLGHEMDILDPNRFLLRLAQGRLTCRYQPACDFSHKQPPAPIELPHYDGVIPRFGTASTEMGIQVLNHFQQQGVAVLNSAQAFRLARDKWQSLQTLAAAGIAVPDSVLSGELYASQAAVQSFPTPFVIKTLAGSQGVGVMLGETASGAASLLETLKMAKVDCLLQRFIAESSGQDIRAFVIGDQVVAAMVRTGASGEFRANIHQGGSAAPIVLTQAEKQLAVQAAQTIGLDIAGVDLIRSHHATLVLEVNASPGLEMIEKISQLPLAEQMIERLLQKIGSVSGLFYAP